MRRSLTLCVAAFTLLGLLSALGGVPATASLSAAPAADTPDPVRISLTRVSPSILTEKDNLIIAGSVANASFTEFDDVMVQLRLSNGPLANRAQLGRVTAGNPSWDGDVVSGSTVSVAGVLGVGGRAQFRIELPASALPVSTAGAYSLGVEVVASDGGNYDRRGMARTLLPWMPTSQQLSPTRLAWIWPLADSPSRDERGVLLGERTQEEISLGGRLRNLVEIGAKNSTDVTWLADPALLQTVQAMTQGYLVDIDGNVEPGTRSGQARTWITLLNDATSQGAQSSMWVLPYADVDAGGLHHNGLDRDLVRAITTASPTASDALGHTPQGGLAWAPSGGFDPGTIETLAGTGVRVVVMRDSALPATDSAITPTGSAELDTADGPLRAILLDTGLRESLSMRQQTSTQILLARQRFLAELAFVAMEAPSIPRTLIAGPSSPRWDPSGALLRDLMRVIHTTSWIDPVPLSVVLADAPSAIPRTVAPYVGQSMELPKYYFDHIKQAQNKLTSLSTVLADPTSLTEPALATLLRAESTAWRFHISDGEELINSVDSALNNIQNSIHVISRNDVILSGDTGSIPVTIANDLDQQVTVGLRLVGTPTARLDAQTVTDIVIEPGKRASVVVPVRVVGSESVQVAVQLLDGNDTQFGKSSAMQLQTTAYSRAARWFTIGAAILLALMVLFDIYRRVRHRRRKQSSLLETGSVINT
ncbi:unannotated protein [freshwater metagenome]|uniref:Unannotated protein n=1 Tax=freshwater metagenome TaxID=449393 RepID=A0A6J7HRK7_9ZZZZ|nr:hypothetical protein [Actinomycetota bacterium]